MALKNADLGSKKEALQRLINGEVFYTETGVRISYDDKREYPFVVELEDATASLEGMLGVLDAWLVDKKKWYEDLGEGVLCWVWQQPATRCGTVRRIVRYVKGEAFPFTPDDGGDWKHAEPLTREELEKFFKEK